MGDTAEPEGLVKMGNFISGHPYAVMAVFALLIVVILVLVYNAVFSNTTASKAAGKKKRKPADIEDKEVDDLIDSIHAKQRVKK